jgi:NADH-quinone oxidoreductase subunit G
MPDTEPQTQPQLPEPGPDEVALLIDDRPVVVKKGTTVLQAAEKAGFLIPHYCYHPGLSIAGNCRMCLIEIEKMPKLQIGCATLASQGMVVRTASDRVKNTREGIMEFLLINHPLDCPICDQAGECRLQQYSAEFGSGESRFTEEKNHQPKRVDLGRHVKFDAERCIKCTRCVRFTDEVSKSHELGLFERGDHAIIGTFPDRPLDTPYSGNTVDICPVGALTWKPFRFQARVWFLKDIASVCGGCARGCNVNLSVFDNRIHRMTPRFNDQVNDWWMCDAGRRSFEPLYEKPRLESALVHPEGGSGAAAPATVRDALDAAAARLRGLSEGKSTDALAAIVSARLSVEDLHLAATVLRDGIGIPRIAVPPHEEGEDDDLLIRRDKTANGRGAALVGIGAPDAGRIKEIAGDIASGVVRGLVVIGENPVGDGLIDAATLQKLEALVVVDWWKSPTVEAAHVALPCSGYGEYEGVYVSFQGRAQRMRAAVKARREVAPAWKLLEGLGRCFGLSAEFRSPAAVFDDLAAQVPAFAGLSYRDLGDSGAMVKES